MTHDTSSPLLLDISHGIARICLNRPASLNAANVAMARAFRQAVSAIASAPDVRAVLLHGAGRSFMAGGDLSELSVDSSRTAASIIQPLHAGLEMMAALPVPVLASVQGAVAGAGVSLMLAADLAIAADDASFNMAYAKIGASPDASASWHLPRVVGLRKAMEIVMLSDTVDASEALRLSLVNRIVPAGELQAETEQLLQRLASGPTVALGRIKALLRASQGRGLPSQLAAEQAAFLACAQTGDFQEGAAAFLEKRRPSFLGR
ncbi:enoyl-CoA hydratase-related protein [Pollutimonas sp. H1-120]|uniref:enoyl-CoA hydratase/isomerase family protein n=1 Tax=Pollutimonas sp. H1-120 TaxID=3148824 RepID=UPI003B51FC63